MKVFDLEVPQTVLDAIAEHAEADYPIEACGIVLAPSGSADAARVVPMKNVQDKYHKLDPETFTRTGRDAFRMDELQRMRVLDDASEKGMDERIVYHSHCDAGAYFSPEDRAAAVQDGIELLPGVVHLVVSVRDGKRSDFAAYRYDKDRRTFDEARLGAPADGLPDLTARAMEGREAARPLRPVGGMLTPRRIHSAEAAHVASLAAGRVVVRSARTKEDLACFATGLYSPLEGFMSKAELRAVLDRGRLLAGAAWREPVVLEVRKKDVESDLASGAIVRLEDEAGELLGFVAISEATTDSDGVTLAGPVYVLDGVGDAAESRARVLRTKAERVLAVPPEGLEIATKMDLSGFDLVLAEAPIEGSDVAELVASSRSVWLTAAMAQNQGATHVVVPDDADRLAVEESLEIRVWP